MAKKPEADLFKQAVQMCTTVSDNFIELARALAVLRAEDKTRFDELIAKGHIGRRKAYYLMRLDMLLTQVKDEERLRRIGWTKLSIVIRYVNGKNHKELLHFAETHTARDLASVLAGNAPVSGSRCLLFYLYPEDHALVEKALIAFGAKKRGKGLIDKEAALVAGLLRALQADTPDESATVH